MLLPRCRDLLRGQVINVQLPHVAQRPLDEEHDNALPRVNEVIHVTAVMLSA